jgi:ElaB/YqjD/DUF883 family membrane-anchored ribosome-binding protein
VISLSLPTTAKSDRCVEKIKAACDGAAEEVYEQCLHEVKTCHNKAEADCDNFREQCKQALTKADEVIAHQEKVINLQDTEIKMVRSNFEQALSHADEYKKDSEFKTNLLYIAIPAAILGGFVLSQGLKK